MPRPRPFQSFEDDVLTRAYVEEALSLGVIARMLNRGEDTVRGRIADLGLKRSEKAAERFQDRRQAASERMQAFHEERRQSDPRDPVHKDEQHWRRCLELGGFPTALHYNGLTVHSYPNMAALG